MSEKNNVTANNEQTALTTGGFAALANAGALNDATEDLAGLDLTFDRIKIPAGGSTAFEIPDGDSEEVNMVKGIVGVILLHHPTLITRTSIPAVRIRLIVVPLMA